MSLVKHSKTTWCCKRVLYELYHQRCMTSDARFNPLNIQMLSQKLYEQIFGKQSKVKNRAIESQENINESINHLKSHDLWGKEVNRIPDINFNLPKLKGINIDDHFRTLALSQTADYTSLGDQLANVELPTIPTQWELKAGWTRYGRDGSVASVRVPEERAIVFDIETLTTEGQYPTMATAVSSEAWYSWCSERVITDKLSLSPHPSLEDLIPLENDLHGKNCPQSRLVVGHNVGFDRSFVKEQYFVKNSRLRFMDTMSLHIAISGFTSFQRVLYQAKRSESNGLEAVRQWQRRPQADGATEEWMREGSMNNLSDVYTFHCNGQPLDKSSREVFVEGTMADVRQRYQELMTYCAHDVSATHAVFNKLWPMFFERFPHPVTLAGMLEMGSAYLPINTSWETYIEEANGIYDELQREMKLSLMKLANDACRLLHDNKYMDDPWLWDLDWSVKEFKMNKAKPDKKSSKNKSNAEVNIAQNIETMNDDSTETLSDVDVEEIPAIVHKVLSSAVNLPKRSSHLTGYPQWYRDLCPKPPPLTDDDIIDSLSCEDCDWLPGPSLITTQMRVTPKLLRLTWDGNPLHYNDQYGWGYLEGGRADNLDTIYDDDFQAIPTFPTKSLYAFQGLDTPDTAPPQIITDEEWEAGWWKGTYATERDSMEPGEVRSHWSKRGIRASANIKRAGGMTACKDVSIPGCWFYQIPHKDGVGKRVGNPLAKDYQSKLEDGTLKAWSGASADQALSISKMCSYWKNNRDRIESLMYAYFKKTELPRSVTRSDDFDPSGTYGAIIPRVVVSGTVTRRAVEPTWLTASNAYEDRIGSELKAMIQSPPGYHFVGADVDSQELWIAALLGDAEFNQMHGCTALGWMTLQGNKTAGTDLHSITANAVGISRDHAKVFNYGRIYGAGQRFAERLLTQFNHRLSRKEAKDKATRLYSMTKGVRNQDTRKWEGGSESEMFNKLEEIANHNHPKTPVLECSISKSLEPDNVQTDFITSRINWVVQSSAVDYLHLMLVCMRWLIDEFSIDARFSISIHDEVRYLVRSDDRYRAALALQVANLLTRSMFTYKVGIPDLPQSVAFFSAVDIDKCLRKEVTLDCVTPSNPHGMDRGYGITPGEALDIYEIVDRTGGSLRKHRQPQTVDEIDKVREHVA